MDPDEEDVLYASQTDPGREGATLIGEGRKHLDEVFQDNTEKLKQTLCFCAAFLGLVGEVKKCRELKEFSMLYCSLVTTLCRSVIFNSKT